MFINKIVIKFLILTSYNTIHFSTSLTQKVMSCTDHFLAQVLVEQMSLNLRELEIFMCKSLALYLNSITDVLRELLIKEIKLPWMDTQ